MVRNNCFVYRPQKKIYFFSILIMLTPIIFCNNEQGKTSVLVVTVGRSGSSCLSGVLQIMGVPFGSNVLEKDIHNPKGFFENKMTSMVNSLILGDAFLFCSKPQFIEWSTHPKKEWYTKILRKNIEKEFDNAELIGIKNLNLGYLLPLYVEALESLEYKPKIIIAIRDPYKVCKSFLAWEELSCSPFSLYQKIAVQFSMILKYIFEMDAITIDYDDLLDRTEEVVNKITTFIPGLRSYQEVKEELDLFIDKKLNHH